MWYCYVAVHAHSLCVQCLLQLHCFSYIVGLARTSLLKLTMMGWSSRPDYPWLVVSVCVYHWGKVHWTAVVGLRVHDWPLLKMADFVMWSCCCSFSQNMGSVVKPHQTVVYLSVGMAMLWCDSWSCCTVLHTQHITIGVFFPCTLFPILQVKCFHVCHLHWTPHHRVLSRKYWPNSSCDCTQCCSCCCCSSPCCGHPHYHVVVYQWVWCQS